MSNDSVLTFVVMRLIIVAFLFLGNLLNDSLFDTSRIGTSFCMASIAVCDQLRLRCGVEEVLLLGCDSSIVKLRLRCVLEDVLFLGCGSSMLQMLDTTANMPKTNNELLFLTVFIVHLQFIFYHVLYQLHFE